MFKTILNQIKWWKNDLDHDFKIMESNHPIVWTQNSNIKFAETFAAFSLHSKQILQVTNLTHIMCRDQPNSRFHGRDIFRQIGLLPWKTPTSVKSAIFREF